MANITVAEAQAWAEKTKLSLGTTLDGELETQVSAQVLGRVAVAYDVSGWTTPALTPELVSTIIAMYYVAWMYDKLYADDNDDANAYAAKLMSMAEAMITGIITGAIVIPGVTPVNDGGQPTFYPTDASSALCPTDDDPSLGPAKFSMGTTF